MLFNSLTFVVFFVVVVAAYWTIRSWNARKNLLVIASYIFYGAWNPPFAALLFSTTAMDFWLGRQMSRAKGRRSRRAWLVASVCMNLSMLGFFKYGNFLLENFQWLLARIGIIYQPPHLDILLPGRHLLLHFHSLSYTLDIYRDVLKPTKSLRDFVLAVSFFPQLVAGPIVRAGDFLPQLVRPQPLRTGQFFWGLLLMTLGFSKKSCSPIRCFPVRPIASLVMLGHSSQWIPGSGVMAFAGQIFFDFRGLLHLCHRRRVVPGFHLKDNFRFPYAAIGFFRFLAALAYFAFHILARLPLYSARRQSGPSRARRDQSGRGHVSRRPSGTAQPGHS
jgi:D-alanyl-lipoteichoic acid acyltransferase DltB (MBOAT superfamily)